MQDLDKLKMITSEQDEALLIMLLEDATEEVMTLTNRTELPPSMGALVREVAAMYYERYKDGMSANVSSKSQGDISVSYSTDIPASLKRRILAKTKCPMCRLVRQDA